MRTSGKEKDQSGISLFLVNPSIKGVICNKTHMVDNRNSSEITFEKVEVDEDKLLGELNGGSSIIEEVLERAQIGISAEMLGNALQAFDITLEYLKDRKQFGQPIGSFQALQHLSLIHI